MGRLSFTVAAAGIIGLLPTMPACTLVPNSNIGKAVPWSVPQLALAFMRRPNSEKVSPTTHSSALRYAKSSQKAFTASGN